jgi:para-aminobenzoate synthetase component 1
VQVKQKMLNWAQRFSIFCFLDNQQYTTTPNVYECLLAVGARSFLQGGYDVFKNRNAFIGNKEWVFGHLTYELLHPFYKIETRKNDPAGFPLFYLFKPKAVLYIKENTLHIEAENGLKIYEELMACGFEKGTASSEIRLQQRFTKQEYIHCIQQLQQHMLRGDCYEVNFCQEFFAEEAVIDPYTVFQNLISVSPNPFSAFYKLKDKYLMCASPERFLAKQGNRLIAQPIKGTAARSINVAEDALLKKALQHSAKEQAENVMIVDLMRNDLSKICKRGSVAVDELFGVYSFPQVHQLISTISGILKDTVPFVQIIEALFPMGSMTGAPKQRVLQLIDRYEPTARGIFSGSVGYISPDGDFDFNVVIRSIMYNEATHYLSYQVGSGITFYSNAEGEWAECLLKASAMKKVLSDRGFKKQED